MSEAIDPKLTMLAGAMPETAMLGQSFCLPTLLLLGASGVMGQAVSKVFAPRFRIVAPSSTELDASDFAALETFLNAELAAGAPALVVNAVGYAQEKTASQRARLMLLHVALPCFLAQNLEQKGIPLVIFSSDAVFDGQGHQPYGESASPHPLSWYGRAKAIADAVLPALHKQTFIFRLSRVFGPSQSAPLAVNALIARHLQGEPLELVTDVHKSVTYSFDAAEAVLNTLDRGEPGLYHIANSGKADMFSFMKTLAGFMPGGGSLRPVTAGSLGIALRHTTTIYSEKIEPLRPWQEALREYGGILGD